MYRAGDIVTARVRLSEGSETKNRFALVLYEQLGNVVIAGITSNPYAKGIPLTKKEGMPKDSVIKLNYLFTVTEDTLFGPIFKLGKERKKQVSGEMSKLLGGMQD
ncbi:MAG: type II toxin-antitoxin system PemK/MazF family toxin [Candidatus Micrarchaeota archaeon]|nr:type II toxin-antitoxin system PemK/MazF family toxin [Candidatus Micrarchaeota archaeon]